MQSYIRTQEEEHRGSHNCEIYYENSANIVLKHICKINVFKHLTKGILNRYYFVQKQTTPGL